ncbi:MAG: HNH endonuclease signature motif containing protein [Bacteroidota bacterium]
MSRYVPKATRRLVIKRAFLLCEYCLLHESQSYLGHEIDHIKSIKHGGDNQADNLAYACYYCNQYKGSDIGTALPPSEEYVRFYHPRKDKWKVHFELGGSLIVPLTKQSQATVKILKLNHPDRLIERQIWLDTSRYPHPNAMLYFKNSE